MSSLASNIIFPAILALVAWIILNFWGKPILALRATRFEALRIAQRYSGVTGSSSDKLRDTALSSLNEIGNSLLAYSRESSLATRLYCYMFGYKLESAARCLFGLSEIPRGEFSISSETRKNTLNALYISLGAAQHLTKIEREKIEQMIECASPYLRDDPSRNSEGHDLRI
jgi:hypothetical protein